MSCEHDCPAPPVFPAPIFNRPGLERIHYRIGTYAELRARLLAALDRAPALAALTHRGADDPAIALLEGAAIVGDILTFYQSLYANEAYLRTAQWRESVIDLVRLLGYRLAPGVGGEAAFAIELRNDAVAVTVPKGFGFKAQVGTEDKPAEFEASESLLAWPHLGRFHLYRPRQPAANVLGGLRRLEVQAVDGASDSASLAALDLQPGDRVMLVPDSAMWDAFGTAYSAQKRAEIVVVETVETVLDRVVIGFKGSLIENRGTTVKAYPIKRSFRHFGHNAPAYVTSIGTGNVVTQTPTRYSRYIYGFDFGTANVYSQLLESDLPLDQKVDDLAAGGKLVCQGQVTFSGQSTPVPFTVVKTIGAVRADTLVWGNLSGPCTVVTSYEKLIRNESTILYATADLRKIEFHEVDGPELTLRAPAAWQSGAFTGTELAFFGTRDQASALVGRSLLFVHDDGRAQPAQVASANLSLTGKDAVHPWMWPLNLDKLPAFPRDDFDEAAPKVTVYGNVVPATQGKTLAESAIGSGDARQVFQTFAVPKAPLTYLMDESATPAQTPELKIYVDGILWRKVETFFACGPDDKVYIVREDAGGASGVQFGDGKTGARLPSGKDNVRAAFRVGSGAYGALKADTEPQATGKLTGLDKVALPEPVTTGAGPESEDVAREAAPGRVQSLGRLVSLADFEAETLALPNVLKANAAWAAPEGVPLVQLTVLTQSESEQDVVKIRDTLAAYNRCRGPARFPIRVTRGLRQYVYVKLTAGFDPARREADVRAAIERALGMAGTAAEENVRGLFGLHGRRFGQSAHTSQIIGAVQQVPGVVWVTLAAAQTLPLGMPAATDPETLAVPLIDAIPAATLSCPDDRILALHGKHLAVSLASAQMAVTCAA